jgi:hypothetical protein
MAAYEKFAEAYGVDCYQNETVLTAKCKGFVKPTIPFSTTRVPCPFESSMCQLGGAPDAAVSFDSGVMDLHDVFGINLDTADAVGFRKRTTCTPLSLDNRTQIMDSTVCSSCMGRDTFPGEMFIAYFLGSYPNTDDWPNVTMVHSMLQGNMSTDILVQ